MKAIREVLNGQQGDYIFPFFWQHGEDEATLREYMEAIDRANIRSVCVECRPHPDFCGEKWWQDMDVILDEARRRNMHVWILDDDHFPTGHCCGAIEDAPVELRPWYINCVTADAWGPTPANRWNVAAAMEGASAPKPGMPGMPPGMAGQHQHFDHDEQLLSLTAWQIGENGALQNPVDVSACLNDGVLTWDVPNGSWRLCAVFATHNGDGRTDYMNILDKDSVRVLIDQVYEPHYARYAADFGKTIRGFFSDEPMVGNIAGMYQTAKLGGQKHLTNPWEKELPRLLEEKLGADWAAQLPLLWQEGAEADTARVRMAYMDAATKRIEENFAGQLGAWCEAHNVEYIGHIWEDVNLSYAFGGGLGHYFRAMHGNHMGGVDIVFSGSMKPWSQRAPKESHSPGFYYYVLGKLASSFAAIDPKKKGRALCESFGATGWDYGLANMKHLADNLLVSGINRYVPHAFSPAPFPDPDCPPHFYAHGENAQYRAFGELMKYMQRMCHLLDGGSAVSEVAVLYAAENDWVSELSSVTHDMYCDTPAAMLAQAQINYDILPADALTGYSDTDHPSENGGLKWEKPSFRDHRLWINDRGYKALVVPASNVVSPAFAAFADQAAAAGFPVFYMDVPPVAYTSEGRKEAAGTVVPSARLVSTLEEYGATDAVLSPASADIRIYHYQNEGDLYLLVNNDIGRPYKGTVQIPNTKKAWIYDAWENKVYPAAQEAAVDGSCIAITVAAYNPVVLFFADECPAAERAAGSADMEDAAIIELTPFILSSCMAKDYPAFANPVTISACEDIAVTQPDRLDWLRYETSFKLDQTIKEESGRVLLQIDHVFGTAEVFCNDTCCGHRIAPEWTFDLTEAVKPGENRLRIDVALTPARKVKKYYPQSDMAYVMGNPATELPEGIVGNVKILHAR